MESYLMMLYVTLEQESALKNFFVDQGWMFCKPDLSVTTDKLGPAVQNPPVVSEEISLPETDIPPQMKQTIPEIKINIPPSKPATGTSTVRRGKRKTKSPKQTAIRIKQAKVASASVPEPSESNENLVTEAVESNKSETLDTSKIKVPITVQVEDGNQFTIKIEQESEDVGNDKGEVDNSDVVGNDDFDDGDDDNDEETNVDYSFEGASTSEGDTSVKMESQSLGNNSTNVNTAAKGGSSGKAMDDPFILHVLDESSVEKKATTLEDKALLTCAICDYKTSWKSNLTRHLKIHSSATDGENSTVKDSTKYTCDICDCEISNNSNFQRHLKLHDPEKPAKNTFVCDTCGHIFTSRFGLKMHCKSIHLKTFKYKCEVCTKGYNQMAAYKGHMASHMDILKEKCPHCTLTFQYKNSLKEHVKSVHGLKTKLKCKDPNCTSVFSCRQSLNDHNRAVHSSSYLPCLKCGKRFKWRSSLKYHDEHLHK
ncbi:protein sister of odd and bowel-like isoform X7 [Mercenaria mercenaria]|uniref:protein sister of odd and bowel-like isoform X7 n=1 Tax=Mercenaria mercenaria TaxID=6596 RepID=UPI00234FA64A|nr:protein sister of odd and bowel-like isoform X7 [Mercenaria mercenaria]